MFLCKVIRLSSYNLYPSSFLIRVSAYIILYLDSIGKELLNASFTKYIVLFFPKVLRCLCLPYLLALQLRRLFYI
jgi:hypothetical protein